MNDFQAGSIRYFSSSENRLKTFRKAKDYLEYLFEIPLTLSDKAELIKEVKSMTQETMKTIEPRNYQEPEQVATARFLLNNYPSLDFSLVRRSIVNHRRIKILNEEIKFLRYQIYN